MGDMMLKHNSRTNYRIYGHFSMRKAAKEMNIMSPSYRIQSTCNKQCTFFMITHNTYNILGAPSKKNRFFMHLQKKQNCANFGKAAQTVKIA
ncbi:hypothetical protein [Anaplasma phagocytophilum]|uniref:hypothetical protein n=1 Tax=Anaplasma phagocytophilum TaxID=948 RepID=UPI0011AA2DEC|nr:hypothetical protein [Anaplasma phagocytophilum]